MESYVLRALELSCTALGFSCHAPLEQEDNWHVKHADYPGYLEEIRRLKQRYGERIELYTGLELEYRYEDNRLEGSDLRDDLDYTIASVHMLQDAHTGEYLSIDDPVEEIEMLLEHNFGGDIRKLVGTFYQAVIAMIEHHRFDILGHLDLIKKRNRNNRFFDPEEPWYRRMLMEAVEAAGSRGVRIEVNTGGLARGATDEVYPDPRVLRRCRELDIPLVLSADAHSPGDLNCCFDAALEQIRDAGYTHLDMLLEGTWQQVPITD